VVRDFFSQRGDAFLAFEYPGYGQAKGAAVQTFVDMSAMAVVHHVIQVTVTIVIQLRGHEIVKTKTAFVVQIFLESFLFFVVGKQEFSMMRR
jgi:hypothetical protein